MIIISLKNLCGFSPRNGEVILKLGNFWLEVSKDEFQSPQWGSNSKADFFLIMELICMFQSPQWGSNSKADEILTQATVEGFSPRNGEVILKKEAAAAMVNNGEFQSPQWGSNSKVIVKNTIEIK